MKSFSAFNVAICLKQLTACKPDHIWHQAQSSLTEKCKNHHWEYKIIRSSKEVLERDFLNITV